MQNVWADITTTRDEIQRGRSQWIIQVHGTYYHGYYHICRILFKWITVHKHPACYNIFPSAYGYTLHLGIELLALVLPSIPAKACYTIPRVHDISVKHGENTQCHWQLLGMNISILSYLTHALQQPRTIAYFPSDYSDPSGPVSCKVYIAFTVTSLGVNRRRFDCSPASQQ